MIFIIIMKTIIIFAALLGAAAPGFIAKNWKNEVASRCTTCDNPQPNELAILLTGGQRTEDPDEDERKTEVLFTNGSSICELPPLPQSRHHHTQSGLTTCGGGPGQGAKKSCIKFESGSWTTLTDNLVEQRLYHSSWVNPDGDTLLIGGVNGRTTEIVYQNGTSISSFDLKYYTINACSIELPEMFILTGGRFTNTTVSRYSTSGWIEDLPELNEGRDTHGCGFFYNDDMQRVFLVAGGGGWPDMSSTETLVEGGQAWNLQQPLPSGRAAPSAISLPNTVIMTGGYGDDYLDEVLAYVPETSDWKKIGSMKTARFHHAASLVNLVDVINYCNLSFEIKP